MRHIFRGLKAAVQEFFKPWPEPDEDTVTPAAMRQWVAGLRHPPECDSGCQCKWEGGDTS